MFQRISIALLSMLLSACSMPPYTQQAIISFYDYQLYSPQFTPIDLQTLPDDIDQADIILIGEWHTHAGIHRFQSDFLKQRLQQQRPVTLSMEQFSRDKQSVVDRYLAGEIGEQELIKQGAAWPNYESDYRPLVELAKSHNADIIAANAPRAIVRCIGRQGLSYLDTLDNQQRQWLAPQIDDSASPYKEKFMASMHHGTLEQTTRQYAAQVTWDETMADSIVTYLQHHPSTQIVHIAGKFHTEQGLGTKASILKRNPNLKIVVITPSSLTSPTTSLKQDYWLNVLEPPIRYVSEESRQAAYRHIGQKNNDSDCQ